MSDGSSDSIVLYSTQTSSSGRIEMKGSCNPDSSMKSIQSFIFYKTIVSSKGWHNFLFPRCRPCLKLRLNLKVLRIFRSRGHFCLLAELATDSEGREHFCCRKDHHHSMPWNVPDELWSVLNQDSKHCQLHPHDSIRTSLRNLYVYTRLPVIRCTPRLTWFLSSEPLPSFQFAMGL